MKIGWMDPTPRSPAGPQLKALEAWGAKKIYSTLTKDTWEDFVGALRANSQPCVADLFNVARDRDQMFARLEAFAQTGLMLWLINDKRYLDGGSTLSMRKAIKFYRGLRTIPNKRKAQEMAAASKVAREAKHPLKGPNRPKMLKTWRDKRIKTDMDAALLIGEMAGKMFSGATLRREFDKSGRPRGRRT